MQMFKVSEQLLESWSKVTNGIDDSYKKAVTTVLLENTRQNLIAEGPGNFVGNAPSSTLGFGGGVGGSASNPIAMWDPILISMVRRAMPNLMAYDFCGVQPMTGPTGLIFALRSKYGGGATGEEALFLEADTVYSGTGATAYSGQGFTAGFNFDSTTGSRAVDPFNAQPGRPMTTNQGENLADGNGTVFKDMGFSIEKTVVEAKTRALKAEWSLEMAQDLKAVHGLDVENELATMLGNEILFEINREVLRTIYYVAKLGCRNGTTQTAGVFDLNVDSNGRWSAEKFKGLLYQINREANQIAKETRRGRGNFVICDSDVAAALDMAGKLDYSPAVANNLTHDDTGNTFVGTINGGIKVYIDPYSSLSKNFFCVGYKGSNAYDAGIFYCPYVPLQMVRAVGQDSFQPRIGFKTRYGLVANPFVFNTTTGVADGSNLTSRLNQYYRISSVTNLM